MTIIGHIKNGRVVLDEETSLPEDANVVVHVAADFPDIKIHPNIVRLTGILPSDIDVIKEYYDYQEQKHK